ncbi:MAG: hypothetical protein HY708_01930, partial [Ignavibacteriae bacterium]|nr:hypothetical protein [Ignavibacteriota bacterium]
MKSDGYRLRSRGTTYLLCLFSAITFQNATAQISNDAVILTLRTQQEVKLDSALAQHIDSGLAASRQLIDTLRFIHAFPDYVLTNLLVSTAAPWSAAWQRREIITGEHYVDSLGQEFGLISVGPLSFPPWFMLTFNQPLQMERLAHLYKHHPDIIYAEPNYYGGDGNRIEFFEKYNIMHFSFSRGWGDCPAGCIYRFYWYVTVTPSDTVLQASLEEKWLRDLTTPRVTRWNNPPRYAMTFFPNVDSIFIMASQHHLWWYRRHAIEGTWRFFVWTYPWVGEDLNAHWYELRAELLSRHPEVIGMLNAARRDPDPDVRISADTALARILALDVPLSNQIPERFQLHQNYPNPF